MRLIKPEKIYYQVAKQVGSCAAIHVLSQELTGKQLLVIIAKSGYHSAPGFKSVPTTSHMFVEKRKPTCQDVNHWVGLAYSQSSIYYLFSHCISRYATKFRT